MTTQTKLPQVLFPDIPRDEPLVDKEGYMTPLWLLFFGSLVQQLQTNFKPEGFIVPPQTAANITLLTGTQSYNNMIYDSTNNAFKGNIAGTWKTFTLT